MAGGAALAGGALAGGARRPALAAAGQQPLTSCPAARAVSPFKSALFNGEGLFVLGAAGVGTAEAGEVLTAFDAINARTGNPALPVTRDFDAYAGEFAASGHRLAAMARSSRSAGQAVSARYQHLRAGNYLTQALFFVLGTGQPAREEDFFNQVNAEWQAALAVTTPVPEQFTVRAGSYTIPVCFFRPDGSRTRRPTLIISSGSDGQNVETMQFGVVAGLERGYNIALFEGPGQMSLLFRQKIPFTPDWNLIIDPIVAALAARPDVRADRIGLIGLSFAGMLCARAAARTPGLRAVVLEPAAFSMPRIWGDQKDLAIVRSVQHAPAPVRARVRRQMNAGFIRQWQHFPPEQRFVIHKRGEIFQTLALEDARAGLPPSDYFGLLEAMLGFEYAADYHAIRIPALLTANEGDAFFGSQPHEAFSMLTNVPAADKRLIVFTSAEGAQLHDQPMAPQFAQETIFGWLAPYMRH